MHFAGLAVLQRKRIQRAADYFHHYECLHICASGVNEENVLSDHS